MQKKSLLSLFCGLCLWVTHLAAQTTPPTRYFTPNFFSAVDVTPNVAYYTNFTIQNFQTARRSTRETLLLDLYVPRGDTAKLRPLVLYFHSGSLLPHPSNTSTEGTKRDSTPVEMCTRLAKLGYVTASLDYRLGWDPTNTNEEIRRYTIINAAYRGIQDARAAIRFFKKNAALYKIDTNRIVLWGQDTGSYITLAASCLHRERQGETTKFGPGKFSVTDPVTGKKTLMVSFPVNGDGDATNVGIAPTGYVNANGGDTLNLPDPNQSFTSKFHLAVNMGGALGDLSWLSDTLPYTVPTITFHTPHDQYAPYEDNILSVITPIGSQPVVRVQGGYLIDSVQTIRKINNIYKPILTAFDPFQRVAAIRANDQQRVKRLGLFPMFGDRTTDGSPWTFWAATNANSAQGLQNSPNMSPARARRYIDSIFSFFAPRGCVALDLQPCANIVRGITAIEEPISKVGVIISPNPATNFVRFKTDGNENLIRSIDVFDVTGKVVYQEYAIHYFEYDLQRANLPKGIYFAKLRFDDGILTKKIVFE